MRSRTGRLGEVFLGGFGIVLGALMLSTLIFEGGSAPRDPSGLVDVSVFFLERSEWRIFAQGVRDCVESSRNLGRIVLEEDDRVVVETNRFRRPVRFTWRGVRGVGRTRDEVHRLVVAKSPPIAVVGSSNTVLTAALAAQLHADDVGRPGGGPLLLIPWATSVSLIDGYAGRTFRFCSNNRRQAELLVGCLGARPGRTGPKHVVVVIDDRDPYSVDLASCIGAEVGRLYPQADCHEIGKAGPDEPTPISPPPELSSGWSLPTITEQRRAKQIWADIAGGPVGETWVVLPLANVPARRMIEALNGAAPGSRDAKSRPVAVLCGDAVGPSTLSRFVDQLVFPVWSVSPAMDPSAPGGLKEDVQAHAEIVAALLIGLDRGGPPPTADDLRATLIRPGSDADAPAPFGRPIAFDPTGERAGADPGVVLCLPEDSKAILVYCYGHWDRPHAIDPAGGKP